MKIIKHEHACLSIEVNGRLLVVDPGIYSTGFTPSDNIDVVVITHEHSDHFDPDKISKIRSLNHSVVIFTTEKVSEEVDKAIVPNVDEPIIVGQFTLQFFGHNHAPIVNNIVPCDNFGVIVNGLLAYPGDSFEIPPARPKVLALPASAPWLKVDETMKYLAAVKPTQVFPTHNALLSEIGRNITYSWLRQSAADNGAEFINLFPGDSIEI